MQIVINKMGEKKTTKNLLALVQISILLIGILAFTNIISAQPSSAPLSTSVMKKVVIKSNESYQESNNNIGPTGQATWVPVPVALQMGEAVGNFLQGLIGKISVSSSIISSGLFWTAVVWAGTFAMIWVFGGQEVDEALFWANAFGASLGLGFTTGSLSGGLAAGLGATGTLVPGIGWTIGIITALYSLWRMTLRVDDRAVVFDCKTWQPQTGGNDCRKCNDGEFPCTAYKCSSLGQKCELENEGDNARCIYKDPTDNTPPTIIQRQDSLSSTDYSYESISTEGVEIKYKGGCLPSFESFTFGIELDKEGRCMMENHLAEFSEMVLSFGSDDLEINHTQMLSFPVGGNYEYYVSCESANGYANVGAFLFKFCIEQEDDSTQPNIQGFNLLDSTPISYFDEEEEHETDVIIYVNEPLFNVENGCKWSHSDKEYDDMKGSMASCSDDPAKFTTFNMQISYSCSGTLTGLENGKENKFYFRCKDATGNVNTFSKDLTLIGSRPLIIDSVGPEGIIKGASQLVEVTLEAETSEGYKDGIADCYYSDTGNYDDYTRFTDTRSNKHSTKIDIPEETYKYYIQCIDMAGNVDIETISFEVKTDFEAPLVIRAYYEGGDLNLITNELAECVYSTDSCSYNFIDGVSIISSDDILHSVTWNTNNNLYVKCRDEYGNQPNNGCSISVRPFEFF